MAPGVILDPATNGAPFEDTAGALMLIRVPVLYDLVKLAWGRCDKTRFKLPVSGKDMPNTSVSPPASDPTDAVSGVVLGAVRRRS